MVSKTMASLGRLHFQSICMAKMPPSLPYCQCQIFGTMFNHDSNQPIQNHSPKTYILHQSHLVRNLNKTPFNKSKKLDLYMVQQLGCGYHLLHQKHKVHREVLQIHLPFFLCYLLLIFLSPKLLSAF